MKDPKLLFYLDDDRDDLTFFKDAAAQLGHLVTTYTNAPDLMLDLNLAAEKPHAIFLDVHMPLVNGEEILAVLKQSNDWKNIPVVMISGAYPKKLVKQYTDSGADYLMKKRSTMPDLKTAIDEALQSLPMTSV
ncbi:response regulator [Flavobacterium caeni]|uniref:CheY chemotaxis protein or a CheY-like REC (Receiver) domain n=1 Tax=Flavobacterium caeni TaxID=490189 RepID=A0A1G5GI84_9FLAO|nr:response regulator [Flavobacterium caeni]SCY51067.1 CheY chemotaxis protein or a CheY-like REC (receiver) domain [Flavobacterium caeni]